MGKFYLAGRLKNPHMPTIESTILINAPIGHVYAIAKDNESFPEFMEDVESLDIVSRDGDEITSDWVGKVPAFGLKVRWRQKDVWDDANFRCEFVQLEGDYDEMSGSWQFVEEEGGTRFNSTLVYEYSVPGLGPLVGKVIYGLVVKNMEGILAAIKDRAEKSQPYG